jgi:hypothetical protein
MNAEGWMITVWFLLWKDFLSHFPLCFLALKHVRIWKKLLVTTKCFRESDDYAARREILMAV